MYLGWAFVDFGWPVDTLGCVYNHRRYEADSKQGVRFVSVCKTSALSNQLMYICVIAHRLGFWLPAFMLSDTLGCVTGDNKGVDNALRCSCFVSVCQTYRPVACACKVRQIPRLGSWLSACVRSTLWAVSGKRVGVDTKYGRSCFVSVCTTCRKLARLFTFSHVGFAAQVPRLGFSWAVVYSLTLWAVSKTMRGTKPTRSGVCVLCPCARPQRSFTSCGRSYDIATEHEIGLVGSARLFVSMRHSGLCG